MYFRTGVILISVLVLGGVQCLSFTSRKNANERWQISTSKGIVQGHKANTYNGVEYWSYRGIPFARPPIGNLRFRSPKPAKPWQGILDATQETPSCVETFLRPSGTYANGTEDCLYINVFTPQDPKTVVEYLPVIVWLHGGAFVEGNSSINNYGPDNFLEQHFVVVTFNYRVGIFGFLSTGDAGSYGNYGLKDQNLALTWVQANIKSFGGNRNLVTIYGQSAGAASAFYHMASPKSAGLFHRIISSSGSSICPFAYKADARGIAFKIGFALNIDTNDSKELVARLRKVDVESLKRISATLLMLSVISAMQEGFPFNPVIEESHKDAFISESSFTLMEKGNIYRVPVLMGFNTLEGAFFKQAVDIVKPLTILFDLSPGSIPNLLMNFRSFEERREAGIQIRRHYFEKDSFYDATDEEIISFISDDQFVRPLRKTVQLIWRYTPVYLYLFAYNSNYGLKGVADELTRYDGTIHGEEISYTWKRHSRSSPKGLDKLTTLRLMKLWYNFAKTGNPTPSTDVFLQNITWPPVTSSKTIPYLKIDTDLSLGQNFREGHMQFWDRLYKQYGHPPYIIH